MPYEDPTPHDDSNPYAQNRLEPWQRATIPGRQDPYNSLDDSSLSQLSLWSMILGVPFLCVPLLGVVSLVLGIIGLVRVRGSRGALRGKGFAIAGISLGGAGLLLSCCTSPVYLAGYGIIGGPNTGPSRLVENGNLTQISVALQSYHLDHGEDPSRIDELVQDGYITEPNTFRMLPNFIKGPPVSLGATDEPVYRYGDYIFAYAGQRDENGNFPSNAVLVYSAKIDPNQEGRYLLLGSGAIVYETEADFRDRIDRENERRAAQGDTHQIDVDAFD